MKLKFFVIILIVSALNCKAQSDSIIFRKFILENLNIDSGNYIIEHFFKPLTSQDTSKLLGKMYFSNRTKSNEISALDFYLEVDDIPRYINFKGIIRVLNRKSNCYESYKNNEFDFNRLNGSSNWKTFNKFLIFNSYNTMSFSEIDSVRYIVSNDKQTFKFTIYFKGTNEISERYKIVSVVKSNIQISYSEINYLNYMDMTQYDSSSIVLDRFSNVKIDSIINEKLTKTPDCPSKPLILNDTLTNVKINSSPNMDSVLNLIRLYTVDQNNITLNQIDSRYLILDFWYKGCVPCLKAIPFLNEISDRYNQNDLKVCGINPYDTDYSLLKQVIEKRNIKYSVFLDFSKGMMKKLLINVFPTVIVIDMKNKTIIYREEGFSEESKNKLTNFLNLELSRLR